MKTFKRKELLRLIAKLGGSYVGSGRHENYTVNGVRFPLPNGREVSPGVMRDIRKFTGIDFAELLAKGE
jgi:hypothetical protein